MITQDVELLRVDVASVWRLTLRIGTRVGLFLGAVFIVIGGMIALFYGLLGEAANPWLPLIAVLVGVPVVVALFVVFVAAVQALRAWLYNTMRTHVTGLRGTVSHENGVTSLLRLEPRSVNRWLFVRLIITVILSSIVAGAVYAITEVVAPTFSAYALFLIAQFTLLQCILLFVSTIVTATVYNASSKPVSITTSRATGTIGIASVSIVPLALWMTLFAGIMQVIQTVFEASGLVVSDTDSIGWFGLFAIPFVLALVFAGYCLNYTIYNWGAKKWEPIVIELGAVSGAPNSSTGSAAVAAVPAASVVAAAKQRSRTVKPAAKKRAAPAKKKAIKKSRR